jgi:hypothetical protein
MTARGSKVAVQQGPGIALNLRSTSVSGLRDEIGESKKFWGSNRFEYIIAKSHNLVNLSDYRGVWVMP